VSNLLHMSNLELLTTEQVAADLGITRQAVAARVKSGTLVPAFKAPAKNGAYLFSPTAIAGASR